MLTHGELGSPKRLRLAATVVALGAEFDAAVDGAEVEPVDEAAIAALLANIPRPRPRPFAIAMTRSATRPAINLRDLLTRASARRECAARHFDKGADTRRRAPARCAVNDYAQE
jgi:hypothetical protein